VAAAELTLGLIAANTVSQEGDLSNKDEKDGESFFE